MAELRIGTLWVDLHGFALLCMAEDRGQDVVGGRGFRFALWR